MASSLPPVSPERIAFAAKRIENAASLARVCRLADVPFHVACAFTEQESGGKNVWGHDGGGVNYVKPPGVRLVNRTNWLQALVMVMNGHVSNGFGPLQVTYAGTLHYGHRDGGYWRQMIEEGLVPWDPADSTLFALRRIIKPLLDEHDLAVAAGHFNGGTVPDMVYGRDVAALDLTYRRGFGLA